jgi:DeoD family purine-nucleoside phosphorylase
VSHIVARVPTPVPETAIHLKPHAELAERVLLPGDPHRALFVAQALLTRPRMFNHQRGLWGYTGEAPDGAPITIQATGMGGPSTAIVVHELIEMGARRLIRIGTCGALDPALELGQLVTAVEAIPVDGTSIALGAPTRCRPDPELTEHLLAAEAATAVTAVSTDVFYEERAELEPSWRAAGAAVVEMEAATLMQLAHRRGVRAACVLAVSDRLDGTGARERLGPEGVEAAGVRLGEAALAALALEPPALGTA